MAANPYVQGDGGEWDERYADPVIGKRNWQIAAGWARCWSAWCWRPAWCGSSGRSRYIPYVVEVDKLGYGLTLPQPLTPASAPDVTARMERYEVAAFIREARAVSSDPQVEQAAAQLLAGACARGGRPLPGRVLPFRPVDITLSRLHRSKRSRCRSIRSCRFRRRATRCAGPSCGAI